MRQISLSVPY